MTNTHINVGGHKITTNKVGSVKQATKTSIVTSGAFSYTVTNGICFVYIQGLNSSQTIGTQQDVATGLPIAKLISQVHLAGGDQCWCTNNGGLRYYKASSAAHYFSLSYPVADDWVES